MCAMTGWLGIRIMYPSGATCIFADCCVSGLAHKGLSVFVYYKADNIIISSNVTCSRHDMAETLLFWR